MEIIELLISGNDGVNIQDAYGSIALHYAAKEGDTKVIELLINHGADVNVQDNDGNTPLNHAEWRKHREIIVLLKKHGARQPNFYPFICIVFVIL